MGSKDLDRYWQALHRIVESGHCRPRPTYEVLSVTDMAEQSAVSHARYLASLDEEIEWQICEAAGRALTRMELGTFGRCLACGEEIGAKRLKAAPWVGLCMRCQKHIETRGDLPKAA